MIILLHSSKTMRSPGMGRLVSRPPQLVDRAKELTTYLKTLLPKQLAKIMRISLPLATRTHATIQSWTTEPSKQSLAIDSFVGDIYSGLQVGELTASDRSYADEHLRILSGLYGIIKPLDGISPYRLEMAYKLPQAKYNSLYDFWAGSIAATLPTAGLIINTSSLEYSQAVLPYVDPKRVITPQFLTINPVTKQPTFVVVHAKIARGAFARWLITSRCQAVADFKHFSDLNYQFIPELSSLGNPTFVCKQFGGLGLSVRLG